VRTVFDRLGITAHEHAAVTAVEADHVVTADGTAVPAAVTVWTAGFTVHPIAAATTLEVTATGQIVVDATMRSVHAPLRYFNQCTSLGRRDGLIQYVTADDRAKSAVLTGRLAAVYKELVCKGTAWGVANPMLGLPTRRRAMTGPADRYTSGRSSR
jgi:NADH:ubiquinone reductase (H+-translocating)